MKSKKSLSGKNMKTDLQNKYILLDTNIIIYSAKYKIEFQSFFDSLKRYHIQTGIDSAIQLEYLRSADTAQNLQKKYSFLKGLLGDDPMVLPINEEIFIDARRISNMYFYLKLKSKQKISTVDCLLAAQLKKYKDTLLLATLNHSDFPTQLFDREAIFTVELPDSVLPVGIYSFSEQKYNNLVYRFSKSGTSNT